MKERAQKDTAKEQQEAEVPIVNPGLIRGQLLLTQGNGYVMSQYIRELYSRRLRSYPGQAPPMMPAATGMGMPPVREVPLSILNLLTCD